MRDHDGDTRSGAAGEDRDGDSGTDERPSLAAFVRDAAERGESEGNVVERVRASYEFDISPRRVQRLIDAERERLDRIETTLTVEPHPPRYVDSEDLRYLTDAEFGRVVSYLLGERDGHSEIVATPESAGSPDDTADTTFEADDDRLDGPEIRWHRAGGTVLVRAVAAGPDRVVDGDLVRRMREKTRAVYATGGDSESGDTASGEHDSEQTNSVDGSENGRNDNRGTEKRGAADTVIVTVADVVPGAARLAVRSGVTIYDRADVRRWLDEARLGTETFGSLIDGS